MSRLPRWKKSLFALLTTITFFALLEGLLLALNVQPARVSSDPFVNFQSQLPLYARARADDGTAVMQTAAGKLAFFNPQQFTPRKSDHTVRIFCLGGSTVYGHPYDDATAFSAWLRELLPAADSSGKQWEVINAGGVSYASYRVAAVMEELAAYQPDLFIVFTGHNEFLEHRTYDTVRRTPAPLRKLTTTLRTTRTFSAVEYALVGPRATVQNDAALLPNEVDAILDHTVGPASYHRDDQQSQQIYDHFAFNLNRMVEIATAAGAEIMFVAPAVNLKDFSPFKSEHQRHLDPAQRQLFAQRVAEAELAEQQDDLAGALTAYQSAADLDARVAAVQYRIGKILFSLGRFDEARAALQSAVDEDVCPLRATSSINQRVRQTALQHGVPLIDFSAILQTDCRQRYQHPCPGDEYFLDHVHPDIATHRLLALGIIDAMAQMGTLRGAASWNDQAVTAATERIASRVDAARQARALSTLAQVLSWAGKKAEAGHIALEAVKLREREGLPENAETLYLAAVQSALDGDPQQAIPLLKKVLLRQGDKTEVHWRLGLLLYEVGQTEQALHHLNQAARLQPADADIHQMIGALHVKAGRYRQALQAFELAYRQRPDDPQLQFDIALTHQQRGDEGQALQWYAQALPQIDDAFPVHRNVARILQKQGRLADAIGHLERALELRPEAAEIRDQLSAIRGG